MKRLLLLLVLLATAAFAQQAGTTSPLHITDNATTITAGGPLSEPLTENGLFTVNGGITSAALAAPGAPAVVQLDATTGHLLHNQAYFYKIVATNATSGAGASAKGATSAEATFTAAASPVPDTYSATVSWTAVPGATGYDIYRSTTTGTELFLASVSGGATTSYTDNSATTPSGALPTANATSQIVLGANGLVSFNGNFFGVQAVPTAVTIGSGAGIASTSLCSTVLCPAGDYDVAVYITITTPCTTTGSYIPWLGYTDDGAAKAGSSTTTYFSGGGLGVTPATASTGATLALASTANFLTGHFYLHTTGAATNSQGSINYGATATACGTGGPMVGKMYLTVTRLR